MLCPNRGTWSKPAKIPKRSIDSLLSETKTCLGHPIGTLLMAINKLSEVPLDKHTILHGYGRAVARFRGYCPTEVLIYISSDSTSDSKSNNPVRRRTTPSRQRCRNANSHIKDSRRGGLRTIRRRAVAMSVNVGISRTTRHDKRSFR